MDDESSGESGGRAADKTLSAAAARALAEADERRAKAAETEVVPRPRELLGREGPEPTRYGDWEHKGIISDF